MVFGTDAREESRDTWRTCISGCYSFHVRKTFDLWPENECSTCM